MAQYCILTGSFWEATQMGWLEAVEYPRTSKA